MNSVRIAIPAEVAIGNPKEYVAYLNDPAVATLCAASSEDRVLVASSDENCVSFDLVGWMLTINKSNFFDACIAHRSFGPYEYPSLIIAFGKDRSDGGYGLLTGPLGSEAWDQSVQRDLTAILPGGVRSAALNC